VGPPKVKKPLTEISGFFRLMNCSLIIGRSVSECKERNLESFRPMTNQVTPDELVEYCCATGFTMSEALANVDAPSWISEKIN